MKEREEQMQVEAAALDRAVEAAAESLWNEREFANPSGPPPWNWCPPGEAPGHKPPRSPALWHTVVAAGEYPASVEETREEVRKALQAADDHLREHYWAEFRERLLAIAKKCSEQGAAEELAGRSQIPALRHAEAAAIREATFAALATTQHKGGSQ